MLLVAYNIYSEDVVSRLKDKAKEYGEIRQILPSCFLVDTTESLSVMSKSFLDIVSTNGRIMMSIIHPNEVDGWLSADSVKWINERLNNK